MALLYEHSRVNEHKVGVGVLQGGKLSPILFNQVYDNIKKLIETKWIQSGHDITQLHFELFADDLLVILKDYRQTKMLMGTMKEAYADLELEINDAKTKIMLIGK